MEVCDLWVRGWTCDTINRRLYVYFILMSKVIRLRISELRLPYMKEQWIKVRAKKRCIAFLKAIRDILLAINLLLLLPKIVHRASRSWVCITSREKPNFYVVCVLFTMVKLHFFFLPMSSKCLTAFWMFILFAIGDCCGYCSLEPTSWISCE